MEAIQNPFRRSRIAKIRYNVSESDLHALVKKIHSTPTAFAVQGPQGTGKSTLLEDIQNQLTLAGKATRHVRIHQQSSLVFKWRTMKHLLRSAKNTVVFLDGGENLGIGLWFTFILIIKLQRTTLVATTHYSSPLTTLFRTSPDRNLAMHYAKQLAGPLWSCQLAGIAHNAFLSHQGNMREVFRGCYLHLAAQPCPSEVTTPERPKNQTA